MEPRHGEPFIRGRGRSFERTNDEVNANLANGVEAYFSRKNEHWSLKIGLDKEERMNLRLLVQGS